MRLYQAKITDKKQLATREWQMFFEAPELCSEAVPGQFVMVECSKSNAPFLRRAISINNCENDQLVLDFAVVGEGTDALASMDIGESVSILGPLGRRGFDLDVKNQNIVLIGGGIGKAPFEYFIHKMQEANNTITFIVGGRTAELLNGLDYCEKSGVKVLYATEDGSLGVKGFVSEYFSEIKNCDRIYACGPTPMLRVVKKFAEENDIPCQLSLEGKMACGIGVCLGCTCKSNNHEAAHDPKVCQNGPVFWSKEIDL